MRKTLISAVVFVNNSGTGRSQTALPLVFAFQFEPFKLAGVMVEPKAAAFYKGDICQTVILRDLDETILQILRMCKFPMVDDACFL